MRFNLFRTTVILAMSALLINVTPSASQATDSQVAVTFHNAPQMPKVGFSYNTAPDPTGSGLIESYSSPTGLPFLSQINFAYSDSPAGIEDGNKYAWIGEYSTMSFAEMGLPFPSQNRIRIYDARIYTDSLVLYRINRPLINTNAFSFCSEQPNQVFTKDSQFFMEEFYRAGYRKCSEVPTIQNYMKQFIVKQVPLKDYSKFQLTEEYTDYSKELAAASKEIISAFFKDAKADNYSFKYTGHGAGMGGLFEARMKESDAHELLKIVQSMNGGKTFAFIDFNTNCNESSVRTLDQVTPYAEYVLASEFERGGFVYPCSGSSQECWQKYKLETSEVVLLYFFNHQTSIRDSLLSILKLRENLFFSSRKSINTVSITNGFSITAVQSLSLVESKKYFTLKKLLQEAYDLHPIDYTKLVTSVQFSADDNKKFGSYDLGAFAKALGTGTSVAFNEALIGYIRSYSDNPLAWDANGISFHMMKDGLQTWSLDKDDFTTEKPLRDKLAADKLAADKLAADKLAAPTALAAKKKTTITCIKGNLRKTVTAITPKCPAGYKKK